MVWHFPQRPSLKSKCITPANVPATARSRAMTGFDSAGPLPFIEAVGVYAGNQLAGREFN
jgi:hypothetical protein